LVSDASNRTRLEYHENGRSIPRIDIFVNFLRNFEIHFSYSVQESRRLSFELKRAV